MNFALRDDSNGHPMNYKTRSPAGILPRSWLGRLLATLVATGLAVVGFFFLVVAMIGAALIAAVVIARIWWIARKLRARRDANVLEGTYSVEAEATPALHHDDHDKHDKHDEHAEAVLRGQERERQ